jgi:hypothetical protein
MSNDMMLYKCPGPYAVHGGHFNLIVIDADEPGAIDDALADGWYLTTPEASENFNADQSAIAASTDANGVTKPVKSKKAAW